MKNVARATIIGNLTENPAYDESRHVCNMVIASNRTWISNGEKKFETNFFHLVAWEKLAELCHNLLKKGSSIYVEGRLHSYEGEKGTRVEIVIDEMIDLKSPTNTVQVLYK